MTPSSCAIAKPAYSADELPRLPLGMMKLGATPCRRYTARLVAA